MSLAGLSSPANRSGAMYWTVPTAWSGAVRHDWSGAFASPKSSSRSRPPRVEHEIGGLEVAVKDFRGVHRAHRGERLAEQAGGIFLAQRGTLREDPIQPGAVDKLRDQQQPVMPLADLDEADNSPVLDCGQRPGFLQEAPLGLRRRGLVARRAQDLDGDEVLVTVVAGKIDGAEGTAAKRPNKGVAVGDPLAWCELDGVREGRGRGGLRAAAGSMLSHGWTSSRRFGSAIRQP